MYFPNTTAMDGGRLWGEWPAENGQACVLFLGNTSNCHSWRQSTGWDGPLVWHSRAFLTLLELCVNVSVPFNVELSSLYICVSLNLLYLSQQINVSLIICLHLLECRLLSFRTYTSANCNGWGTIYSVWINCPGNLNAEHLGFLDKKLFRHIQDELKTFLVTWNHCELLCSNLFC